ncbi:hypothetical protein AAVH_23782 [Aphelenchoides avenae]|nr:hypothetical protein AAVH_23782 [Aphelenchus avenae]
MTFIGCDTGAKFSAQLFDVEAEGLAPLDSHFRCRSETDPGQCDRCCRLWAASEGRSNVVGQIVGETGCYCCFPLGQCTIP